MATKRMTTRNQAPTTARPYVGYGRISRLNGREKGANVSIQEQQREVERIAHAHHLDLLDGFVSDEDVSGSTFARPGWERAIALVEQGKAGGIVAFDMKRMSRGKTAEVLAMVEDVEAAGGRLYDAHGRVSVEGADDELVTTVKAMIARREWRERRAYLRTSVRNAIERGVHLNAPYGYQRSAGKGSRLAVNAAEAPTVRAAFQLRADGHTWPAIAATLNEAYAPPRPWKRDGVTRQAVWTHKTVRQVVGNEAYLGTAYNGEHRTPGAHEAIVDADLYARANRAKGVKPLGPTGGYVLTGLPRCASCGYAMLHSIDGGRRYYRCKSHQHGAGRCSAPVNVPAEALEAYVVGDFKARFLDVELEASQADDALGVALEQQAKVKARMKATAGLLAAAESESEAEVLREQYAELQAAMRAADDAVRDARAQVHGVTIAADLDADSFDDLDVPDRRRLLGEAFAAVVVRGARVWREPAAERARILTRDEAPARPNDLIAHVLRLRH